MKIFRAILTAIILAIIMVIPSYAQEIKLDQTLVYVDTPTSKIKDPFYRFIREDIREDGNNFYIVAYNGGELAIPEENATLTNTIELDTENKIRVDIIETAISKLGNKYRFSSKGPDTFDCSGFCNFCMNSVNIGLPRSSVGITHMDGQIDISQLRPGDIVARSGHVGIYIGDDIFIHAQNSESGVVTDRLSDYNSHCLFPNYINVVGD